MRDILLNFMFFIEILSAVILFRIIYVVFRRFASIHYVLSLMEALPRALPTHSFCHKVFTSTFGDISAAKSLKESHIECKATAFSCDLSL